ncbi:MAG: phospho-N-acetylmuramoyl-pentapeptide-transferase [Oscillospiraceae bacterium]|nr:phospho-N-acetylmuramoyl-pentapeptide-transferase [Oscillospiraceae bacterium]
MRIALAFGIAFLATALVGKALVPWLRRLKAGQSIKEDGPTWHMAKQGTPTMGGIMFIIGIFIAVLLAGWKEMLAGEYGHLFIFLFALIYGAIGFVDDFVKVHKARNTGLTASQKFLLQLAAAITFVVLLRKFGYLTPNLYIPFFNVQVSMNWTLYMVFAAFVIVGTVNAVNITDGVDGLAAGVTLPVSLFYVAAAVLWGYTVFGVFAAALAGGLCAFLLYNFHPAKVFMGDTGSLFLGAAVCGLAFSMDMPLILILVGIIYLAETLSDIIQIVYFKATHGRRIFRMAPLHHHLEMGGWKEEKLFFVFSGITLLFCLAAFYGVMDRFAPFA